MSWPQRSIISVEQVPHDQGGGLLILCDCGTGTHLTVDLTGVHGKHEAAFTCDGCHTTTWFTVTAPEEDA